MVVTLIKAVVISLKTIPESELQVLQFFNGGRRIN